MAKPVIKFSAVAYDIGGKTGYRPQLEAQDGVYDLDFCREVVTEKRLAMSADELLHAVEMLGEVGPSKVASDGRPRGVTKLLKYNRYAKGNLESPTSAWNDTCKALIRAQLMNEAEKEIDATFVNVNSGIGVRLNYVAWLGAQTVTNVIKVGKQFAAYGNHMEWLTGDTAKLIIGTQSYNLTCTESDVAHAVFNWPAGLAPEAGTVAQFVMLSRGGIEEGEVYTSKKLVTIIAADPTPPTTPTFTKIHPIGSTETDVIRVGQGFVCEGTLLTGATAKVKYYTAGSENEVILDVPATDLTITATSVTVSQNWVEGEMPAVSSNKPVTVTLTASGVSVTHDAQFVYPV